MMEHNPFIDHKGQVAYGTGVSHGEYGNTPLVQSMVRVDLASARGLVIRQETQHMEAILNSFGVPYEEANAYSVSWLPNDVEIGGYLSWTPSGFELKSLPLLMRVEEESGFFTRVFFKCCGMNTKRPLTLHYFVPGAPEQFAQDKPCRLGGCCCCPAQSTVYKFSPRREFVGKVYEDWHCGKNYFKRYCQSCVLCTNYTGIHTRDAMGNMTQKYTIRVNTCCWGGSTNNCCGNTPCKENMVFDILDENGRIVGHLQMMFGGGTDEEINACCRWCYGFSNYALRFPTQATEADRILLLAAVLQIEYQHFEIDDTSESSGAGGGGRSTVRAAE